MHNLVEALTIGGPLGVISAVVGAVVNRRNATGRDLPDATRNGALAGACFGLVVGAVVGVTVLAF